MRHVIRTVMTLAALTAMLGGVLGQGSSPAASSMPGRQLAVTSVAIDSRPLPGETPLARWAYAINTSPRISLNPDPEAPLGKAIEVSIADQRLTAWENGKIAHRFKVSTARPGKKTPKGHFRIKLKAKRYWSRQFQVWMPDALWFHGDYFIHSLPYRSNPSNRTGADMLGIPVSAGCVRLGVVESKVIYDWASVGTPVWVH
ncbi:MAG TPA: L,D-transpeptidase [Actinomycetota bacterium]|nr:L,D-transpeptidase [Actinomycetota bacterium]